MNDRTDVTVVEFGTGDILIVGLDWDEENAHGVLFSEDVPKDITKWNTVDTVLKNISEAKNPVVLRFSRKESIDQLIDSLIEVRNAFKLNSGCSEKPNDQQNKRIMDIFNLYFKVPIKSLEEREKVINHLREAGFYYPDDDIDKSKVIGILVGNAYVGEMTTETGYNYCQHLEFAVEEVLSMKFGQDHTGKICGDCGAFCKCQMAGAEHNYAACSGFYDSVLSQLNSKDHG